MINSDSLMAEMIACPYSPLTESNRIIILMLIQKYASQSEQYRQRMYNVTLRLLRVTTVVVENRLVSHIPRVCLLTYVPSVK
jgi:hypothetical protein